MKSKNTTSTIESPRKAPESRSDAQALDQKMMPAVSQSDKPPTLPALTSIRIFLAMAVLIFHYSESLLPALRQSDFVKNALANPVGCFFCLSGFILCYQYPKLNDVFSTAKFAVARFARIVPLCWFALFLALAIGPIAALCPNRAEVLPSFLSSLFIVQAWIPNQQHFFGFNAPAYSLAIEGFLYCCFPLLVAMSMPRLLLVLAISLALPVFVSPFVDNTHFYNSIFPAANLSEFVTGIIAAKFLSSESAGWSKWKSRFSTGAGTLPLTVLELACYAAIISLPLIGSYLFIVEAQYELPGFSFVATRQIHMMLFAVMLISLSFGKGLLGRVFSNPFLVVLGETSYAVYLLHMIFMRAIVNYGYDIGKLGMPGFVGFTAATIAIAYVCYRFIENPARKFIVSKSFPILDSWKSSGRFDTKNSQSNFSRPAGVFFLLCVYAGIWATVLPQDSLPKIQARALFSGDWKTLQSGADAIKYEQLGAIDNAKFGNMASLSGVKWRISQDTLILKFRWKALHDCKGARRVNLQFIDNEGKVVSDLVHRLNTQQTLTEGIEWTDMFSVKLEKIATSAKLGVLLFETPGNFDKISSTNVGVETDQDGSRLLFSLKDIEKPGMMSKGPGTASH